MSLPAFKYSATRTLRAGEVFRARGGPTYKGARIGDPGLYRMQEVEEHEGRIYLLAIPVSKFGLPVGGTTLLFVQGEPYYSPVVPGILMEPYKISRLRKQP